MPEIPYIFYLIKHKEFIIEYLQFDLKDENEVI